MRREIAGPKRMEGVKESEKAIGLGGSPSRLLCQVDEAGKDEKTDGERRNLQQSGDLPIYIYFSSNSFLSFFLIYFVAHDSIPSFVVIVIIYILFS